MIRCVLLHYLPTEHPSSVQRHQEWEIWDCAQIEVQESSFKLFIYENTAWDLGLLEK